MTQKSKITGRRQVNANRTPLRATIRAMKGLITLAKDHPKEVWNAFRPWYGFYTRFRRPLPCWIIERIDGEEIYIHLLDFKVGGITKYIRKYCERIKLDFLTEISNDPTHKGYRYISISKNGKPLLQLHDTTCSTRTNPYICVHLQAENIALKTLLDLFRRHIKSKDILIYRKFYKGEYDGLFGIYNNSAD